MITRADVASDASISLGPYLGSDPLPVITISIRLTPKDLIIPPPKWILNDDHWHEWNAAIAANLNNKRLFHIDNPQEAYDLFSNTLIETSHSFFKMTKSAHRVNPEKSKPWWATNCNTHVKDTRRALAGWISNHFSTEKMMIWRKKKKQQNEE
jgi:hypothetical protein